MPCNTCFILGAGFSAPAGIPTQRDLLRNIFKPEYADCLNHIRTIFGLTEQDKGEVLKDTALEDVFTFLDKIISGNDTAAGFDIKKAYDAKRDLIDYIIKELSGGLKKMQAAGRYEYFFNSLAARKKNDNETNTVITFNWDTISDFYINGAFRDMGANHGVDYGCYDWSYDEDKDDYVPSLLRKEKGYKTIKLFKMHGSINWVYKKENGALYIKEQTGAYPEGLPLESEEERNEYEHIFMTPTFLKDFSNIHTQSVWHNALFDLLDAKRLVFLGCSMPLADYEFRYLLLKTAVRNKENRIRVALYPKARMEDKKETKSRFRALFAGNDLDFREIDIDDFLIDRELIWDW
jgi:hypothetical protein